MADSNNTIQNEIWKDIPGHLGYEVSNLGRVRSYRKRGNTVVLCKNPQRILMQHIDKKSKSSYPRYRVNLSGKFLVVHRLVLLAFVGPCPEGMEACHNDGNPYNNRLDNLRWDTKAGNILDEVKNGNTKITPSDVVKIRELYKHKLTLKEIGEIFQITHQYVSDIVNKKSWKFV